MPTYYWFRCIKCPYREHRYRNVKRCPACSGDLIHEEPRALAAIDKTLRLTLEWLENLFNAFGDNEMLARMPNSYSGRVQIRDAIKHSIPAIRTELVANQMAIGLIVIDRPRPEVEDVR